MKRMRVLDRGANGKPTRWQAFDTSFFEVAKDASQRRMTPEGFMVVPANISCADNVQEYSALELGIEGTNRTIRLYRPKAEVFKPESYATFERQTLTNNHPDGDVTASTYRSVTAGDVHDVAPAADDKNLGANLYIKAADTIEMVVSYGKNQLSCGYSFVLDMTPGTAPDGQAYDGVMRDIVGNHVALVWNARGGPGLRVADNDPTKRKTSMHTIIINGIRFEVADATQGSLIEREIKALQDSVTTSNAALATAVDETKVAKAALATVTEASTKAAADHAKALDAAQKLALTDEQRDALIAERAKVVKDAQSILGVEFDGKGKTNAQVIVAALEHIVAAKDESPAKVGVVAQLAGKKPADLTPSTASIIFDGAVGVLAAGGTTPFRGNDAALRAFAPAARPGVGDMKPLTGAELFAYRETHGGKNPPTHKDAA